jgi:hypothetical protein
MAVPEVGLISLPGLFVWEKDKNFKYVNCNEDYARAAGFDSPYAMMGKRTTKCLGVNSLTASAGVIKV